MTSLNVDPPEDIPEETVTALEESSDGQLREIIHYAQQLLQEHPPLTDAIEAREGEELVRMEEHDDYTLVIVERTDSNDGTGSLVAYRVRWEPDLDGEEEGKYRWHYLGKVKDGTGNR